MVAAFAATASASWPSAAPAATGGAVSATSQERIAKRLSVDLYRARTGAARRRALLATARALRIGVYSAGGHAIVRGAERGRRDVYLYDFEIAYLANALARQESFSAAELAASLTRTQRSARGTVTEAVIARVLRDAVRVARKRPHARQALRPLLIRELGLRQRPTYDLARTQPVSRIRLDAVQRFIVMADIAQMPTKSVRAAAVPPAGICTFTGLGAGTAGAINVLITRYVPGFTSSGVSTSLIHTQIATLVVQVFDDRRGSPAETHYGPAGHRISAGRPLELRIRAEQLVDTTAAKISCGILAGYKLPDRGGLPGLSVNWGFSPGADGLAELKRHGMVVRADSETGPTGVAALVLIPKDEDMPGFGSVHTEEGALTALAGPLTSRYGLVPLNLVPQQVRLPWLVSFHAARGFKFDTGNVRQQTPGFNEGEMYWWDSRISAGVCGESPYRTPWSGHISYGGWDGLYIGYDPQPYLRSGEGQISFTLSGPVAAVGVRTPDSSVDLGTLQISSDDPPKVKYEASWFDWPSTAAEVPLEEDLSCPPLS